MVYATTSLLNQVPIISYILLIALYYCEWKWNLYDLLILSFFLSIAFLQFYRFLAINPPLHYFGCLEVARCSFYWSIMLGLWIFMINVLLNVLIFIKRESIFVLVYSKFKTSWVSKKFCHFQLFFVINSIQFDIIMVDYKFYHLWEKNLQYENF